MFVWDAQQQEVHSREICVRKYGATKFGAVVARVLSSAWACGLRRRAFSAALNAVRRRAASRTWLRSIRGGKAVAKMRSPQAAAAWRLDLR